LDLKKKTEHTSIPSPNLPIHCLNLDLVAFLHHCAELAEFGQQNTSGTMGNVKMGAGLGHAA